MKATRILAAAAVLALLSPCIYAADSAAGQKTFESTCAGCHKLKSYAGKSESDLQSELKDIVAGTKKHPKKLTLNDADIANVAAYISSNEPK